MDLTTFAALLEPAGRALVAEVQERAGIESDLALGTRLRRDHSPELVAAAVTQAHLRGKARTKFGDDAAALWFTHDALEQATRASVARHRAQRLVALGATRVVDLGCGIGADLLAFARAGLEVRGVDLDPVRVAIARANLEALGLTGTVEVGDATTFESRDDEVAFVDPARRDARGRTFGTRDLTPPWDFVTGLLAGLAVAKVMPGVAHEDVPPGVEAEWVSEDGDLVEACLWGAGLVGGGATPGRRRATVLPSGLSITAHDAAPALAEPLTFLVEPDDAVIRAGLVAEFADQVDGVLLDRRIAWVTTDAAPTADTGALGRWFRVLDELPFREKQLKAALRDRDIGTLTIKKRGVDIVPEQLVRRLKLRGSVPGTVVMTRVDDAGRAFLVAPVPRTSPT